jgi:hypothetical protein
MPRQAEREIGSDRFAYSLKADNSRDLLAI